MSDIEPSPHDGKRQLIAALRAEMQRMTGKDYRIQFDRLGSDDLAALLRFVRDCDTERSNAVTRQRLQPWRRM